MIDKNGRHDLAMAQDLSLESRGTHSFSEDIEYDSEVIVMVPKMTDIECMACQ